MRWERAAFVMVLSLGFNAQAQDNVVVDLSVLDGLSPSYIAPAEPMFPVLPKQKVKPVQKAKKAPVAVKTQVQEKAEQIKKEVEAAIAVQPKPEIFPEEEKIVVVDVEPVEPAVENKSDNVYEPQPQIEEERQEPVIIEAVEVETRQEEPTAGQQEEISAEKEIESQSEEPVLTHQEVLPTKKEVETQPEPNEEQTEKAIQSAAESLSNNSQDSLENDSENEIAPAEEPKFVAVSERPQSKEIVFEEGVSELTSEQMSQIDSIVGHFDNSLNNKVAIYSYNVEGGVNSFRKKRISLNRAIEVRSYLLRQGFKNFSIKVININSDSDKANTVELEEI